MKNNIGTIIGKELKRFFGDKRLFFTTVLMPGLMIFIMYTFMGDFLTDKVTTADDYVYKIVAENMPASVEAMLPAESVEITPATDTLEVYQDQIRETNIDLYISFPADFEEAVAAYETSSQEAAPLVEMYYVSTETNSSSCYSMLTEILNQYESSMSNKFDINIADKEYNLATDNDVIGMMMSTMLPMLLLIFVFSACIAVAPESIAGEKERGTIATLLVTPMKRSELAIGKIISLSIISLLGGFSSFLGTMLSLPKMLGMAGSDLSTNVYKVTDYIWLLGIILSTTLVMISLVSIISANAKSVKEASTSVGPLMIVIVLIGLSGMIGGGVPTSHGVYCIPLYNSVQCMTAIFGFEMNALNVTITILANIITALVLIFGLTKMFESEKVMFS